MATPTLRKKDVLRHLVSYLHGTKGLCLCLHYKGDNVGVHHQYFEDPDSLHLEVFSDPDWASNKSDRKSVSGGFICLGSCLMYSSSRTQKVISLSSGEAEVYAASSAACDSILLPKMVSFLTGAGVVVHHLLDSSAARGILSRQGVGRIRHLSCRVLWLQTLVKLRREFSCDQYGRKIHSTCHLVSAVLGHVNLADLGTKRLAKKRLLELMCFCNLGFVENDIFTVIEDLQNVKQIQRINHVGSLIAQLTLVQNALSRCNAEKLNCSEHGTASAVFLMNVTSSAFGFIGYINEFLFMTVELYAWQLILLALMLAGVFLWMVFEIRGYQASLASWSSLTSDMFEDETETRKEAFGSYMRWKRGQAQGSSGWIPGVILDYFGNGPDDFERPERDVRDVSTADTSSGGNMPMEIEEDEQHGETESQKRLRYQHQTMDESSDVEMWMQVHHHHDMDVFEEVRNDQPINSDPTGFEVQLEDMIVARERARRIYEERRLQLVELGDLNALEALERNYEWVHHL